MIVSRDYGGERGNRVAPFSMVLFLLSCLRFSEGTFWYGAYSTMAYDSLPGHTMSPRLRGRRRESRATCFVLEEVAVKLTAELREEFLVLEYDIRSGRDVLLVHSANKRR